MNQNQTCPICEEFAESRVISVRSGKEMRLWRCAECNFDFFSHDPTSSLAANQLDKSRLEAAGLNIPPPERDFANGLRQSADYVNEYIDSSDRGRNILEVGCSWGYFLKLVKDAGGMPYGIELNSVRRNYVSQRLEITCDDTIVHCEKRAVKFRKIFLFYVLEYVPQPLQYVRRLLDLLEEEGQLILLTPSLDDPLKDVWRNPGFIQFFYDEHAINYFSPLSVNRMLERLDSRDAVVSTRQGYTIANHLSWFLTNAPRTTGVVSGDNFIRDAIAQLRGLPPGDSTASAKYSRVAVHLADMIEAFDAAYRQYLEDQQLGNQIRIIIKK